MDHRKIEGKTFTPMLNGKPVYPDAEPAGIEVNEQDQYLHAEDAVWAALKASEQNAGATIDVVNEHGRVVARISAPAVYAHTN